ncbi:MAG: LemA family protein [Bdellovibrio sp.]
MLALIFVIIIGLVILFMAVSVYNSLVSLKQQIDRAWANIEVVLKQRFDEIPQLIEVIEQYASYEQNTLKKVIEARNQFVSAKSMENKIAASNEMSLALQGIVALGEAYPELKANSSFVQLQGRISELEGLIADRREFFNETVTNYNTRIYQIPDMFFARMLGYSEKLLYRPPTSETTRPSLKMDIG